MNSFIFYGHEGAKVRRSFSLSLPELRSNSNVIHQFQDSPRIFFNENSGNDSTEKLRVFVPSWQNSGGINV